VLQTKPIKYSAMTACGQVSHLGMQHNQPPRPTQHSIPSGQVNGVSACLARVKTGHVHPCPVAAKAVWPHTASDAPYL